MRSERLYRFAVIVIALFGLYSCSQEDPVGPEPQPVEHTEAVKELIRICPENSEVRRLLEHSIQQAAAINPDRRYNPAQTFDEFCTFVDRNVRCLPWDVMLYPAPNDYGRSLYGRVDQGVGYFWFVVDQPLDELRDRGYYYPTVEFVEPFSSWLSTYGQSWGDWLSTEESWNDTYFNMVLNDPDWGFTEGWYGTTNQWHTFNEFFARSLVSPDVRPIADADVVAPVDSWPKRTWQIDDNNLPQRLCRRHTDAYLP